MGSLLRVLFSVHILFSLVLLAGALWSVAFPRLRIWPPPGQRSWQYALTWACYLTVLLLNTALLILDWNTWGISAAIRLLAGAPLTAVGVVLAVWGYVTLGVGNSAGLRRGFVTTGPYGYTRNPQYVGVVILYVGLSLVANSMSLSIAHALLILVFMIAPLAEESWLEEQYGQAYLDYKRRTHRYL